VTTAGNDGPIVIVGGGHAAAQLCAGLRASGHRSSMHLVCEEPSVPYHRPPLSKAYLKSQQALQTIRSQAWYLDAGITLHLGDRAVSIDRSSRKVQLASGSTLDYANLVIATGMRARLPIHLPDGLDNVVSLRDAQDALRLRELLARVQDVTVLGGGFIGLEIAATARATGKAVTIIESAPRLLSRSVSPEVAEHVLATHRAQGIICRLGVSAGGFEIEGNRLVAMNVDGEREAVALLVLGIGATPEHTLATEAGLDCDNGIVVDEWMRTSDPSILAIGDCASFPIEEGARRLRLESVQNANDQARTALATLRGDAVPYRPVPWFWSEQGSMRLQMVGLMPKDGEAHRLKGATGESFSVLHYAQGRLVCVESINASADHMAARKLVETNVSPDPSLIGTKPLGDFL
jgi:3-phenylpropionate/trans-cinnamate dioxygenase ferredoxin reductase subunit